MSYLIIVLWVVFYGFWVLCCMLLYRIDKLQSDLRWSKFTEERLNQDKDRLETNINEQSDAIYRLRCRLQKYGLSEEEMP